MTTEPKYNVWWGPPKKFTTRIDARKISWLELFYDLVYVIAISRVTHLFAAHPGLSGLLDYAFLFAIIFWGWVNGSLYYDLHGTPGIRTRFMTLWQMMAISALVICLDSPPETMVFNTTVALMVLQIFIIYLWWSVGIYDKAHRVYNKPYTVCFLLATALLGTTLFMESPWNKVVAWIALVLDFVPPFIANVILRRRNQDFTMSSNMAERLGLFTIIVFGECVLGVINGITNLHELNVQTWLNFGLGILIVFALWWIFFSIVADRESRPGFLNATLIEITYIPTMASLGLIGASLPGLFLHFSDASDPEGALLRQFLGPALCCFLAGITLLSFLLQYGDAFAHAKKKMRRLLLGTGLALMLLTIFFPGISLPAYLLSVFIFLLVIIVVMTRIWFAVQLRMMGGEEGIKG